MIPVGVVLAIGGLAICLHIQRRKRRTASYLLQPPNSTTRGGTGRAGTRGVLERDLEAAWVRGATRQPGRQMSESGSSTPQRPVNRWQWTAAAGTSRAEEGLNEFGEPPPPYEKQVASGGEQVRKSESDPSDSDGAAGSAGTTTARAAARAGGDAEAGVEMHSLARVLTTASSVLPSPPPEAVLADSDDGGFSRGSTVATSITSQYPSRAASPHPVAVQHDAGPSRTSVPPSYGNDAYAVTGESSQQAQQQQQQQHFHELDSQQVNELDSHMINNELDSQEVSSIHEPLAPPTVTVTLATPPAGANLIVPPAPAVLPPGSSSSSLNAPTNRRSTP